MSEIKTKKILNIQANSVILEGELTIPQNAKGLVLFVHGSGSGRLSPRNNYVARVLQESGLATFLFDLLTKAEDLDYEFRFNIDLLSKRLAYVTKYLREYEETKDFRIGYFGASTGAAAAIKAAVEEQSIISAIVSRGGRVDLAEDELEELKIPTMLIVGEKDDFVLDVNKEALKKIKFTKTLSIIPNANHLFEEPGALEEVAREAAKWFTTYLKEK